MGKTRNKFDQLRKKLWGQCRVASEQPTSQPASRSTGSVTSYSITDKSPPSNTKVSSGITVPPLTGTGSTTDHTEPPSKRLWHAAFDSLENGDKEIAKYVARYKSILQEQLGEDDGTGSSRSHQLDDPGARQAILSKFVEKGREKIQNAKSAKLVRVAGNISVFILEAEKLIDAAGRSVPQAALPWAGVCLGWQILSNPMNEMQSNLEGIAHVISRMKWFCAWTDGVSFIRDEYVQHQKGISGMSQVLEDDILTLYRAVLIYQIKSVCSYYNNQGINFVRGLLKIDDWDTLLRAVMNAEQTLQSNLRNYQDVIVENTMNKLADEAKNTKDILGSILLAFQQFVTQHEKMILDNQDNECLRDLQIKEFEIEKVEDAKEHLLDGISDWIFDNKVYDEFTNWDTSQANSPLPRLMWIRGEPGTGKTMLMMSIIRKLSRSSIYLVPGVSYFFCQGIEGQLRDATAALRCLVWQLLIQQPLLITHVRDLHRNEGSTAFQGKQAFFTVRRAFKSMLQDENLRRIYLIVDALDECEQGLADLRQLISESLELSDRVKWLVSSRPCIKLQTPHVIDLDKDLLKVPVSTYISRKLATLKGREGYDDEILAEIEKEVCERAENTFLWVALAFKELNVWDNYGYPVHGCQALGIVTAMPLGLTQLYNHILSRIKRDIDAKDCENLLEAAAFAYRPLTPEDLDIFGVNSAMRGRIITKCSSFLKLSNNTLYLIHQTAKEYLDETYKSKSRPAGTVAKKHWDISRHSIIEMSTILKKGNIYGIEFGTEAKDIIPKHPDPLRSVRYACVFWADHICLGNDNSDDYKGAFADDGMVHVFLKERLLFWLESLALMGQLPKGVSSARELHYFVQAYNPNGRLVTFLEDVVKFVNRHVSIIRRAPLQAYTTALVFSPRLSEVVKSQWQERPSFIKASTSHQDHWDEHLQTLECDGVGQIGVEFLPDEMTLVSSSFGGVIWVWDVNTWTLKTMFETAESIMSISLSNNGKHLALVFWDGTVGIWDANTWAHERILGPCPATVKVAFSSDSMTLALLTENSIWLWDVGTWTHKQTIEGHLHWNMTALAFSSDGKFLASPEMSGEIRISGAKTGLHLKTIQGHRKGCEHLEFSPDSMTLASGSNDKTVRLWDTTTWANKLTLEGHESTIKALAFSKNGLRLASASYDETVRVWDVNTGSLRQLLRGHHGLNFDVAFSPNGRMLASASGDGTVRIWDTNSDNDPAPGQDEEEGYASYSRLNSRTIAFSNDGAKLASALSSEILRVWDATRGVCLHKLDGHRAEISAVTFSADNSMLASGDYSGTIFIWDTDKCSRRTKFRPDDGGGAVDCLAFSPNGATLASVTRFAIRLWDTNTGVIQQAVPYDHMGASMAFFSDSLLLVSQTENREGTCAVHVWDTSSGSDMQIFKENFEAFHYCFPSRTMHPKKSVFLTTFGSISLSSLATALDQETDQLPPPRNLYIENDGWMVLDGQRILWLPPDYRVTAVAIYDNRIVLRHRLGHLTFLTLGLP